MLPAWMIEDLKKKEAQRQQTDNRPCVSVSEDVPCDYCGMEPAVKRHPEQGHPICGTCFLRYIRPSPSSAVRHDTMVECNRCGTWHRAGKDCQS